MFPFAYSDEGSDYNKTKLQYIKTLRSDCYKELRIAFCNPEICSFLQHVRCNKVHLIEALYAIKGYSGRESNEMRKLQQVTFWIGKCSRLLGVRWNTAYWFNRAGRLIQNKYTGTVLKANATNMF